MVRTRTLLFRSLRPRILAVGVMLGLAAACSSGGGLGPSAETASPADSTLPSAPDTTASIPTDSTPTPADSSLPPPIDSSGASAAGATLDTRSSSPGIVFAVDALPIELLSPVLTGTKQGGAIGPSNILSVLAGTKARGGRILVKLSMGSDSYVKNADGTFSFTKWKALVDRFRTINLNPYITDGTLLGHFLIDEPHRTVKWGGKIIPHATLEAMARYSKDIWPGLSTFTHTQAGWLVNTSVNFTSLDAVWVDYFYSKGEVNNWIAREISSAKSKGLGVMAGLNVLGGGGPNGLSGYYPGKKSMSATELRTYGTALLNQSYACAFVTWQYKPDYYGRSDIKSALADLSSKAKSHVKTSCRQ